MDPADRHRDAEATPLDRSDVVFILSLPRSGSTLLQRIVAAHTCVASSTEPWLLLPLFYSLRSQGHYAEYGQGPAAKGLTHFIEELPGGRSAFLDEVSGFARRLYGRARSGDERYFLDKTPRNGLIVDELREAFPQARFIFLWRQPLAIIASLIESFGAGRWNLYRYSADLFDAMERLVAAFEEMGSTALSVRYEDLVADAGSTSRVVFDHLGLPFEEDVLTRFVAIHPTRGDQRGTSMYDGISSAPLDKWQRTLRGPLRRRWCRRYLNWLEQDRLATMGYDREQLLQELAHLPRKLRGTLSDAARMAYGAVYCSMRSRVLKRPVRSIAPRREQRSAHDVRHLG